MNEEADIERILELETQLQALQLDLHEANHGCDQWKAVAEKAEAELSALKGKATGDGLVAELRYHAARIYGDWPKTETLLARAIARIEALEARPAAPVPAEPEGEIEELVAGLNTLSAWLSEYDFDMRMPPGMLDPAKAAATLIRLSAEKTKAEAERDVEKAGWDACCESARELRDEYAMYRIAGEKRAARLTEAEGLLRAIPMEEIGGHMRIDREWSARRDAFLAKVPT